MNLIDTHAHLYAEEFRHDFDEVVQRAKKTGVTQIFLPNIDVESVPLLKETVRKDPAFFFPMMGLHPTSVKEDWQSQLEKIYSELNAADYIGIGEIGIDLYWDNTYKQAQISVFEEQLQWSKQKQLPVAIHSRNAIAEVIASIKKIGEGSIYGVFHSFGGTVEELKEIQKLKRFKIGINGVVTFKNSSLEQTLRNCDINNIILETDAPYLAPVPYRGKRNEPTYLQQIVAKLSDIYGLSETKVAQITSANAKQLFNISNC
ncbi:MAG: TatD family hydrolase [Petrimonas sp.]|nr:TatD family hydrolase [Petrimonas sp.]